MYLKVIQYQKEHGHLPNSSNDFGIEETMTGPVHYQKQTDSTFILYFGRNLGESMIYHPETDEWISDGQ